MKICTACLRIYKDEREYCEDDEHTLVPYTKKIAKRYGTRNIDEFKVCPSCGRRYILICGQCSFDQVVLDKPIASDKNVSSQQEMRTRQNVSGRSLAGARTSLKALPIILFISLVVIAVVASVLNSISGNQASTHNQQASVFEAESNGSRSQDGSVFAQEEVQEFVVNNNGDTISSDDNQASQEQVVDWDALIQEAKEAEDAGKKAISEGKLRYEEGGLTILGNELVKLSEIPTDEGPRDEIERCASRMYGAYFDAFIEYYNILIRQPAGSDLYAELRMLVDEAGVVAEAVSISFPRLGADILLEYREKLYDRYREKYIWRFNEFTEGETWSRSESWDLMSDAHEAGLINDKELDDPLRLRYCYAMAMINRKINANAVKDGSITASEAIDNLLDVLPDTDYNPILLYDCWNYAKTVRDDREDKLYDTYRQLINRVESTQKTEVDIERFWYFNDFGDFSPHGTNGVTPKNREWIRDYMQGIKF